MIYTRAERRAAAAEAAAAFAANPPPRLPPPVCRDWSAAIRETHRLESNAAFAARLYAEHPAGAAVLEAQALEAERDSEIVRRRGHRCWAADYTRRAREARLAAERLTYLGRGGRQPADLDGAGVAADFHARGVDGSGVAAHYQPLSKAGAGPAWKGD